MLANKQNGGALEELARLRRFTGAPAEFWSAYIAALSSLASATRGIVILQDAGQPDRLKKLTEWSEAGHADRAVLLFNQSLGTVTQQCARETGVLYVLEKGPTSGTNQYVLACPLPLQGTPERCVAAFLLPSASEIEARESLIRLRLAADVPLLYQLNQSSIQARHDVEKFASVLDVLTLVNSEQRFIAASLAFCNGLATRFSCERASLGWLEHGYIRLQTISRTERFDKNMAAVKAIEVVMEESLDQDEEILWPSPENSSVIVKDHQIFSREQNSPHVCSVPLRLEDKPIGVITCERLARPFSQTEVQQLRLAGDQAIQRLADLKKRDRWFGARLTTATRENLSKVVGPRHTWAKIGVLAGALGLLLLFLPIFTYRVEGNFIVRSDDVSYQSAPFDGFIRKVMVRPGDQVKKDAPLVSLDTADLEMEEAAALADQTRYLREGEKARATKSLADMRIAEALAEQARAHLEIVRNKLNQAAIRAPFDGIVVEGDLRQRIGTPVKSADALFKVARIDTLYVEAEINERDIHEILDKSAGEIAFVTQPKNKYRIRIIRIEPSAAPKEKENIFVVRCAFDSPLQPWWRPGMSGIVKIDIERRTLLWILSHRTVDFLRMTFWW